MAGIGNSVKHAGRQITAGENTTDMSEAWWGQKSMFWSEAFDLVQNEAWHKVFQNLQRPLSRQLREEFNFFENEMGSFLCGSDSNKKPLMLE